MKDIMVKKNNIIVFGLFFCLIPMMSCSPKKELGLDEYAMWIENTDNGLSIKKEIADFEFRLIYKPIDYVIAYEYKKGGLQKDSIVKRKEHLKNYQYYTLKIKSTTDNELMRAGIQSDNEYYERLEYFTSNMQDDMVLVDGKDTLPCVLYHFERNYGVSPYNTMVMAFEDKVKQNEKTNDKLFIYDDKILGTGKIAIKINGTDIDNSPALKLN
jgi:hypothetical protein